MREILFTEGHVSGGIPVNVSRQESSSHNSESRITNDGEAMKQSTSHLAPSTQTDSIGFYWDGLALLQRGDESYLTEGHVSGGIPIQVSHEKAQGTQKETLVNSEPLVANASASTSHLAPNTSHSATTSPDQSGQAVVVSDFLGTTLGTVSGEQFAPVYLTVFGEVLTADNTNILDRLTVGSVSPRALSIDVNQNN